MVLGKNIKDTKEKTARKPMPIKEDKFEDLIRYENYKTAYFRAVGKKLNISMCYLCKRYGGSKLIHCCRENCLRSFHKECFQESRGECSIHKCRMCEEEKSSLCIFCGLEN